jgi:hypothetical protein
MPSSPVRSFSDPSDYALSMRATKTDLTVVGRGQFAATITRIYFDHLRMQRFSENLPRIMLSANWHDRAIISFQTALGPALVRGGVPVRFGSIARLPKDPIRNAPPGLRTMPGCG